jgi:hypothetical protein
MGRCTDACYGSRPYLLNSDGKHDTHSGSERGGRSEIEPEPVPLPRALLAGAHERGGSDHYDGGFRTILFPL